MPVYNNLMKKSLSHFGDYPHYWYKEELIICLLQYVRSLWTVCPCNLHVWCHVSKLNSLCVLCIPNKIWKISFMWSWSSTYWRSLTSELPLFYVLHTACRKICGKYFVILGFRSLSWKIAASVTKWTLGKIMLQIDLS